MKKGTYVIVRCKSSGVFAGYYKNHIGQEIELSKVRKLWYWDGACAVEQISLDGVNKPENCKFTVVVDNLIITDAIQILKATKKAKKIIEGVNIWKK